MKKLFLLLTAVCALMCIACKGDISPKETYTVEFETDGGTKINPQTVKEGEKAIRPDPDPQKEGYDFAGWFVDDKFTTEFSFDTKITSDLKLFAKWTEKPKPQPKPDPEPQEPEQQEQQQQGEEQQGGEQQQQQGEEQQGGEQQQQGEEQQGGEQQQQQGEEQQGGEQQQQGEEQQGGEQQQQGGEQQGGEQQQGEEQQQQQDPPPVVTYNVTFETNGGTEITQKTVNEGDAVARPADPEKEGYIFTGWYADEEFNNPYNFETPVTKPVTIYAKWTIRKFTVTFVVPEDPDAQVQITIPSQTIDYKGTVTRPASPEKEGYDFAGWYADEALNNTYNFDTPVTAPVTIYVKWTIKTFLVNFVVPEDPYSQTQLTIPSQTIDYNGTVTRPADPEKEGYDFAGWYADEALNNTYNFDTPVTAPVTIYVKWTIKTFLVSFVVPEDPYSQTQLTIPSQTIDYNGTVTRPASPEKVAYIFAGWYADEQLNNTYNFNTPVTAPVTIYTKWTIKKFTVNFVVQDDPDSPTQIVVPSQTIDYNGTVTKPADPQQQNAEFRGWYSDSKFKTSYAFDTAVTKGITLYGHLYEFPIENINYEAQQVKNSELTDSPYPQTYQYPKYSWTANGSSQGTAIDGLGKFKATCEDIDYSVNVDGNRKIELKKLSIEAPSALENITMGIKIHVENGTRNGTDAFETTENILLSNTKEIITIQNTELNNYLDQKKKLYFEIRYTFTYNNKNYECLVFKNDNNKWYTDPGVITGFGKYPLVQIVSTANGGSNRFVTEPKSRHIKNQWSDSKVPDPYYVACKITAGNVVDAVADVKVRGNYTTGYAKKSLRIKFDKKQNMFGLNKGEKFKSWVLLSVFKDASLLRDATAFKMFHEMFPDYYASDTQLVEVVLNGTYMGVYLLAEQQQTNKKRINISEAEKNSSDTQIGYLLEFDNYYDTEELMNRFEIHYPTDIKDYADHKLTSPNTGYTIKSDVYSMDQRNFIMNYMNNLWKICYEAAYNHKYYKFNYEYRLVEYTPEGATQDEKCQNCINRVIDTTSLANMYIFSEITCDPDLYWSSFYMDIDFAEKADKKLRFEAPWDFDSTMGNKRFSITGSDCKNEGINAMFAGKGQPDVNGSGSGYGNPWMVIFINQTWFKNLVKAQWATVNVAALKSSVSSFIDTNSSGEYTTVFNLNRDKWGNPGDSINELCSASKTAAQTSQAASAEYFKNWLTTRIDAVNTIINGL